MARVLYIAVLSTIAVLTVDAGYPQSEAGSQVESQVQRLVAELDSPQLRGRNTAEQSLFQLGRKIGPFLPMRPTVTGLTAEQWLRLDRIRKKWDTELLAVIREGVHKTATVSSSGTTGQCTVELDWSPLSEHTEICPIRLRFFGRTFLVKDVEGNEWCPTTPEAVLEVPMSPKQHSAVLRFPVTRVDMDKDTKTETQTPTWQFLFACKPYPFHFPVGISEAAEFPQRQRRGDVTVELLAADWNPNRREYITRIEIRYETPRDSLLSYRQWPESFRPELRDTRHRTQTGLLPTRTRMVRRTENSIQSEFTFDLSAVSESPDDLFLFFRIPTEIRDERLGYPHSI